jgi:hypothetical protein
MTVLPPIDRSALPADVRNAPEADRQRYEAALGFERQLVAQLAKQLTKTAGESLGTGPYAQMLPDTLADAVIASGGLGLARELADLPEVAAR